MIRNLKSKLKAMSSGSHLLDRKDTGTATDYVEVSRKGEHGSSAADWKTRHSFNGQIIESTSGAFVLKRSIYEMTSSFGHIVFSGLADLDLSDSSWWTRTGNGFKPHDIVFFDAETTGLAGGNGTYAFLVGLGYITDAGLVIEQYLMRDFDEEYPMLQSLISTLRNFRLLVTFNGKAFDWPLLETRLVYSRLSSISWENAHLDLLHTSRRLWGKQLESCSLSCIEEKILSHIREDDIPGFQIPGIYFDYLETRNADTIEQIMQHNEWDIAAMAALLIHIKKLYEDPLGKADEYELLAIAKELERNCRIQDAAACYQRCIQISSKYSIATEAKKRLAYLKKKHEGPEKAMDLWIDLAEEPDSLLIFPLIEMAKFFEHREKDYKRALACTERAIVLADRLSKNSLSMKEELLHRRRRLRRKLKAISGGI